MLETPHVVVGAAIAAKVANPFLAIPLAFASHFILDMIPHWNPHLNTEIKMNGHITKKTKNLIYADAAISLISAPVIATSATDNPKMIFIILLGAFAGALPDLIEAPYYFLGLKQKTIESWITFQKRIQVDTTPLPGIATQMAVIIAALWWIYS